MSIYSLKSGSEAYNRHISAKPLSQDVKISPQNSMVMFNLNGTLMRSGVLLRKVLKHTCQKAVDNAFHIKSEVDRAPIANYLNHITTNTSQRLEEYLKENKEKSSDFDTIFALDHILPIVEHAVMVDDYERFITKDNGKVIALGIANHIHNDLMKNEDMKPLIEKALGIYDKQTSMGSQKIILSEVTKMLENLANLGVPVAIVSNMTQDFVNNAFDRILETLSVDTQKKFQDKQWHFSKIGVQRDVDGDIIQPVKPAADLLVVSHAKADKFNMKNHKPPIKNVVFVGYSEPFDMRAADNLKRSHYGMENNIEVYKLLCKYDDPAKQVYDQELINAKCDLKHINQVNERLSNVFDTGTLDTEKKNDDKKA